MSRGDRSHQEARASLAHRAVEQVRRHLAKAHPDYVTHFDRLVQRAREQQDE